MNQYEKVEALRKQNPHMTLAKAIKAAKVGSATYYRLRKTGAKPKRKYRRMEVEAAPQQNQGKIPVIFCTPEQIKELFN